MELLRDVLADDGIAVPAGTRGTIVATSASGEAEEVESSGSTVGLATVLAGALRAAQDGA